MFAVAGIATHICYGSLKKAGELVSFFFCKAGDHVFFCGFDDAVDEIVALTAPIGYVDALAAAIIWIGAEFQISLFLQTAQKAGDGGMAQMEGLFDIPGTWWDFSVGEVTDDPPLGGGQLHAGKGIGNGLVCAPVKNADLVAKVFFQNNTPKNVASYRTF